MFTCTCIFSIFFNILELFNFPKLSGNDQDSRNSGSFLQSGNTALYTCTLSTGVEKLNIEYGMHATTKKIMHYAGIFIRLDSMEIQRAEDEDWWHLWSGILLPDPSHVTSFCLGNHREMKYDPCNNSFSGSQSALCIKVMRFLTREH